MSIPVWALSARFYVSVCLLIWLIPQPVAALQHTQHLSQYVVEYFARDSGLPADVVWVARQGPQGYLWLGTQNGLARYDGSRFTRYDSGNLPGLRDDDIRALTWDAEGALWVGTYGGGALRWHGDTLQPLGSAEGLPSETVYDLHGTEDGAVWFATGNGVARWQAGEITHWGVADGVADLRMFKIAKATDGTLWFSSLTNGLSRFDGSEFRSFNEADGLDSGQIHLLVRDPVHGLIAGTLSGRIYSLEGETPQPLNSEDFQPPLTLQALARDASGDLWLGSYGAGLWRHGAQAHSALPARERFAREGRQPDYIFDLHQDRNGNLWAATMQGLYRFSNTPFLSWGKPEGLSDSTFVVHGDGAGGVYAGSEADGLFHLSAEGTITAFGEAEGLPARSVSALLRTRAGALWVGSFGGGLVRLAAPAPGPLTGPPVVDLRLRQADGLPGDHIMALLEDGAGRIWIATDRGVARWHDGVLQPVPLPALGGALVRHLLQSQDGSLWFASNTGLLQYTEPSAESGATADTPALQHLWTVEHGLPDNLIQATHEDDTGALWLITRQGGLARLQLRAKLPGRNGAPAASVVSFGPEQGLPRHSALSLLEDAQGEFWIGGPGGLLRVARSELEAVARGQRTTVQTRLYDEGDGLRSAQMMGGFQPAAWRSSSGQLWFASSRGLINIDPERLKAPDETAQPLIEAVRVDGQPVSPTDWRQSTLQLAANTRSLEIDYTVPRLANAQALRFRYRLGAENASWQDVGDRRTAYFTGLPAGEQVFAVQAQVGAGDYNSALSTQLRVQRAPLWYQTSVAFVGAVLLMLLSATALYRLSRYRSLARERALEALVDLRTHELRDALAQVEAISRTDALTGIANRRYFEEKLQRVWKLGAREQRPVSVLMIDIDHFKAYNDSAGHQAGDSCLRQVAQALGTDLVREYDLVARYGGEEFIAVLYDSPKEAAVAVAERLISSVRALALPHPSPAVGGVVSISIGCASGRPDAMDDPYHLIDQADQALYRAKQAGRNRARSFDA